MKRTHRVSVVVVVLALVPATIAGGIAATRHSSSSQPALTAATPPPSYTVTDAQCTAAETGCAMTFVDDPTKDVDPYTGIAFGQPRPGLLSQNTNDVGLTAITSLPACAATMPTTGFHNCRPAGYTSGTMKLVTPANNGQRYYFDNCIISNPIDISAGGGAVVPGLAVYLTNCHVKITGDNGGFGSIGNGPGGGLHMVHDLLDGSGAPSTTHPVIVQAEDAGVTSNFFYNEWSQNTDQVGLGVSTDAEWNYFHNSRCDKATTPACQHTDGGAELYGGGAPAPDASHPITLANNYFSCLCDSTGGPANITTDYGRNGYIWILNNKALPTYGSGYNPQGIIAQQNVGSSATLTNVHIVGNAFFASASHPPSQMGFGGSVCSAAQPNSCLAEVSGNTQTSASGVVSKWSSQTAPNVTPASSPSTSSTSTTTSTSSTTTTAPTTSTTSTTTTTTTTVPADLAELEKLRDELDAYLASRK